MSLATRIAAAVRAFAAQPVAIVPAPAEEAPPAPRRDTIGAMPALWQSPYGLGGSDRDRTAWFGPTSGVTLDPEMLQTLWEDDPIAGCVVDAIVDDGMRDGFRVAYLGTDDGDKGRVEAVQDLADALELVDRVRLASKMARAFGGSGLVMLANGGRLPASMPLEPDRVGSIDRLIAQDARRLVVSEWDLDVHRSYIWAPAATGLTGYTTSRLDASHVIAFEGLDTSLDSRQRRWTGWWKPVLQHVWEAIRDYRQSWQSVVAMLQDGSQGVLSLPGLADAIVRGGYAVLEATMRRIQLYRWSGRIMPIDAGGRNEPGEKFEWVERSFAGISEVLRAHIPVVAQAAGMPIPRLFKDFATSGLNDSGSAASKDWNATVASWRGQKIEPPTVRLVQLLARVADATDPDHWGIEWPGLEVLTSKEKAEIDKTITETDADRVERLGVPQTAILRRRYYQGWSTEQPQLTDEEQKAAEAIATLAGATEPDGEGLSEPTGAAHEEPAVPSERQTAAEVVDPKAVWTGPQQEAMRATVLAVSNREIPRASGVAMLLTSLPITRAAAEEIMGEVGRTFFATKPEATPAAPGAPPTKGETPAALEPEE